MKTIAGAGTAAASRWLFLLLCQVGLVHAMAFAQDDAGTAAYLELGTHARSLGMGGAFVALADDAAALQANPAGLATLARWELASLVATGYGAFQYGTLELAGPGLAAGYQWLTSSRIEARDEQGLPTGTFGLSVAAIRLGAAGWLGPVAAGASLTYTHEDLAVVRGQGFTADVGLLAPLGSLQLGLVARNLWGSMTYASGLSDPLDPAYLLGIAWVRDPFTLALEYELGGALRAGAEIWMAPSFALRGGLARLREDVSLTCGLGVNLGPLRVDYGYLQPRLLPGSHRLSLGYRF